MTSIATLRATNCSRLLYITERTVAACGTKTAYVFQYKENQVEEASCTAPREADVFVPWLPPGAPITATRAVYSIRKDGGSAVLVQPAESAAAPLEVIAAVPEKVEELRIFYQSILILQTASTVYFYFLDPSTSAATLMGNCGLPAWSDSRDVRVDVTSSECWVAAAEKTICVMCISPERLYVAVVVCASTSSAVMVRRTAEVGVPLPSAPAKVLGWTLRWARQELVLLLQPNAKTAGAAAEKRKAGRELASFSLQASSSSATHPQLERWMSAERLATALSGAVGEALKTATDVSSDGDGTHVWLCDTVTGPSVILREVATEDQEEVVLTGTNANSRLTVARGVPGMFVLAGRSLYVVRGGSSRKDANLVMNDRAAAAAGAEKTNEITKITMSDWLEQQRAKPRKASPQKATESEPAHRQPLAADVAAPSAPLASSSEPTAVQQSKQQMLAPTSVFTSSSCHIKEKLLQYVFGHAANVSFVVRDAVYVREAEAGATNASPRHEILAAIAEKFCNDAAQHALATLRYAAVAQSLHPYTVLELLSIRRFQQASEGGEENNNGRGLLLAIATVLAQKPTLEHGGLQRLPNFAAVSAAFFHTPGGAFATEFEKKRYTADLCACAMAALANGGLGATRLLFAAADRAVSVLYGGRVNSEVNATAISSPSADVQACEATIAESISLMRSYVEWSLSASSSLGLMSAHVGTPQALTKEAALRDGKAHPIDTSRQVEIRPLRVTRLPKKTL